MSFPSSSSIVEVVEGFQILLVDLALQLFGDAVREFVIFFNPLSSFGVLDGHSCDACRKTE